MLLTRSIRRKLILGLGLVLLLVMLSTTCSILGVASYRRMVNDLETSIRDVPRRSELVAAVSGLLKPLSVEVSDASHSIERRQMAASYQYERFCITYADVRRRVDRYERAWQQLPDQLRGHAQEEASFKMLLRTVDQRLRWIADGMHRLADPATRKMQVDAIVQNVAELVETADTVPDPANRLIDRLQEAKSDYLFHLRLVSALGVVSVALLLGLSFWGHELIFAPIHKLYQGVLRIANGEYGYRIKIDTQCEISRLAMAFNQMSQRIQEDQAHKEREIEERSKQLVLSERVASAGFLASGVAHEINNPLTVIMTAAYGLEMRLDDEVLSSLSEADRQDIREYLALIQSESTRCERITKKLLDFSHGNGDERNLYDVAAIADEVLSMIAHMSRYQSRTIRSNRDHPLHAWCNAPEMKQVLLNLVANALDATPVDGLVSIEMAEFPDMVEIAVVDNGAGMTPEQMERIFEPFFTTKEVGKGTGLGLSITHRIVADHGGTLEVASEGLGKGARFTLRLPKRSAVSRAA